MNSPSPRPIALVGMPGAGKTSVGRSLAGRLGWSFVDTDEIVAAEAGRSVEELFFSEGQAAFRRRERDVIARTSVPSPVVISTGGGAMIEAETRRILLSRTLTIWLRASPQTLRSRLDQAPPRPLLVGPGLLEKLQAMMAERLSFYEQAHLHVATDDLHVETVTDRALAALRARSA